MDLVIERSKWLRGDSKNSVLRRQSDGLMCCLGFLACKVGYSEDEITGHGTPSDLDLTDNVFPTTIVTDRGDTSLCNSMVLVNDNPELLEAQRESILGELFKTAGINVKFVD